MKNKFTLIAIFMLILLSSCGKKTYNLADFGLLPNVETNSATLFAEAIEKIKAENGKNERKIKIIMQPGRYDFYPQISLRAI